MGSGEGGGELVTGWGVWGGVRGVGGDRGGGGGWAWEGEGVREGREDEEGAGAEFLF